MRVKASGPHRDATSPLTIAADRGYEEVVEIIREEETKRSGARARFPEAAVTPELIEAFRRGDEAMLIRFFEAYPALINASDPESRTTALHWASACLWENFAAWLLDRGADARALYEIGSDTARPSRFRVRSPGRPLADTLVTDHQSVAATAGGRTHRQMGDRNRRRRLAEKREHARGRVI